MSYECAGNMAQVVFPAAFKQIVPVSIEIIKITCYKFIRFC